MTLTRHSKYSTTECQDASEGYGSAGNILDLSPIHPVHDASSSRLRPVAEQPVTRFETAFGPDNETVTRVFYADGIATDFSHGGNGRDTQHTPIETHFEDEESPPSSKTGFSRRTSLRHSMHNLFNRGPSLREKKHKEKTSNRRKSTGYGLNDDSAYGCAIGVYSRSSSDSSSFDTPVSRQAPINRAESCAAGYMEKVQKYRGRPPVYTKPPSYDALYPDCQYPTKKSSIPHPQPQPVLDGSKKFLKRKKSLSVTSLPQRCSFSERPSSRANTSSISDGTSSSKPAVTGKEGYARSQSLSDLAGAQPPVENELQKQCQGRIQHSDDSMLHPDLFMPLLFPFSLPFPF